MPHLYFTNNWYIIYFVKIQGVILIENKYNRHNRRKYRLKVPIVLVTKYRKRILNGSIADDEKIFDLSNAKGWNVITTEIDKDHIHFLLSYDATDRICDIVHS